MPARKASNKNSHFNCDDTCVLTNQVLNDHMSGEKTVGIYPLLRNNTCYFLAVDFDKKNWQVDVTNFSETCRVYRVPNHIEISRSGNGAHIWIFFAEEVSAKTARNLGTLLLKETKRRNDTFELNSIDRLFPNQDVLPEGGFGNLIALPLQRKSALKGNSLFVDRQYKPYPDQWMYLSSIRTLTSAEINDIIHCLDYNSYASEMPHEINVLLKNGIHIEKKELSLLLDEKINTITSFSNPNYFKAKKIDFLCKIFHE